MAEAVDGDGDETTRSSSHDDEVSMRKSELEWVAKHSKHRGSVRDLAGRFSGSSKAMSQEELAEFQKNQGNVSKRGFDAGSFNTTPASPRSSMSV
eukprot:CAMPEP_0119469814 /NCGR_PEP_ID=MMETSP1344-20130328/2982_1 /TAXON_ID=236787 /ORGANISM="Florenciella parvula, Strain CCMP2471" /LENGTH=94 /DNA_ID=CAMNT_0007502415 /DNA_START=164 /DNA_END=445 /DNA_ORIENTATION=+